MNSRLLRSPNDRVLAGIAGGMAETYDLDPALVRVGWALLILVSGGLFLILYIVMALVIPLRSEDMAAWASSPETAGEAAPTASGVPAGGPAPQGYAAGRHTPRRHGRSDARGPIVVGLILIVVGAVFLARQFIPALNLSLLWPIVVMGAGGLLILASFGRSGRPR